MAFLTDHLKSLFGGGKPGPKAAAKSAKKPAKTYVVSKTNRAEVIAEAMAVYRRERGEMQAGLDKALTDLRKEAPKLIRDPEALSRLLTLHKAHLDMRRMMASDHERFLVLSGMRELLGDPKAPKAARKTPPKR